MNTIQSILTSLTAFIIFVVLTGFFATFGLTIIGMVSVLAIGSIVVSKVSSLQLPNASRSEDVY